MTTTRAGGRLATVALAAVAALVAVTGCAYEPTTAPSTQATPSLSASPSPSASATAPACTNATQSYAALPDLPAATALPAESTMAAIRKRGRLIAGVSADTYLFGARNPLSGQVEGFDIDIVNRIAEAILGKGAKVELRVITAAQRLDVLKRHEVDIVVRTMTMNCARWKDIAFSAEYYRAGQKLLVRKGLAVSGIADLGSLRVCAPRGTSSLQNIADQAPQATLVPADNHTGCLVRLQQGEVDVITGDDTVLAGLAAQDPYAVVVDMKPFTAEPYGVGVAADQKDLVRFVNSVLADYTADGSWTKSYNRWLAGTLGPAPKPPTPLYGRAL